MQDDELIKEFERANKRRLMIAQCLSILALVLIALIVVAVNIAVAARDVWLWQQYLQSQE